MQVKTILLAAALSTAPSLLHAQFDFKLAGRDLQVHSFGSQGFMYSNQNNYMTMPTSTGSFAFTDAGANISSQITDKFRVGAQVYLRNIGDLGNWRPELDWGYADYRFKSWFGVRAGKVKTTLGLLNDVQDMDSLHTFALLPQSIYPIDWRSTTIAHNGGDVYGSIEVKHLGTFSYTGYAGMQPADMTSGYILAGKAGGTTYTYFGGREAGGDLHWALPFGALVGISYLDSDLDGKGTYVTGGVSGPYKQTTNANELAQFYGQYTFRGFEIDAEYRKNLRDSYLYRTATPMRYVADARSWYVAGTYRVTKRLELGAYYSHFLIHARVDAAPIADQYQYDTAISGKVNLTGHWYVKAEGHFMDGAPTSPSAARGFYAFSNPSGTLPNTRLLVIRTGFSF